jgi:hypothetical protein
MTPEAKGNTGSIRFLIVLALVCGGVWGCGDSAQTAATDNGGIGGTGVSEGEITAFGSIFVNGVEWELGSAAIEVEGVAATEADLRIGMKVRVVGDFEAGGLSGRATRVSFDASTEGPVADTPVLVQPAGNQKTFTVLGQTIRVDRTETVFADGASFAGLAMDQVLVISGFEAPGNTIRATRVELRGIFPTFNGAKLRGSVANLSKNPDGSGIFDVFGITVRYVAGTDFEDITRAELANGSNVAIRGTLRPTGDELDASRLEAIAEGLGIQDAEEAEIEGVVSDFVSIADFRVSGVRVDGSGARLEPRDLVVANGVRVEVEGRLAAGVLIAEEIEDEEHEAAEIKIRAETSAVAPIAGEITLLGVTVVSDNETELEDERDGDTNFEFEEIEVGDWIEIEGLEISAGRVRAKSMKRKRAEDDVILRGPATALDRLTPTLSVLDQPIPLGGSTNYFDSTGQPQSEGEFFRSPGDVDLGDAVVVRDLDAVSKSVLSEADEVELD